MHSVHYKMDGEIEYTIQSQTNIHIKHLESFLNSSRFKTPKACKYTNIINQKTGGTYFIPFRNERITNIDRLVLPSVFATTVDDKGLSVLEEHLLESTFSEGPRTPVEEFFALIEECRRANIMLGFCEQQNFSIPIYSESATYEKISDVDASVNAFELEELQDLQGITDDLNELSTLRIESIPKTNSVEALPVLNDHSCIELDFDVYQREAVRVISDNHYYALIHSISSLLSEHLDLAAMPFPEGVLERTGASPNVKFHAAILRKPQIIETDHQEYGKCYKDSFHMRIFLKVSKEYKKYLIEIINERSILATTFSGIGVLNPFAKVLDGNSPNFPAMLLGSAKKSGKVPHAFYTLYRVSLPNWPNSTPILQTLSDFAPLQSDAPKIKMIDPNDMRRKIEKTPMLKWRYNLAFELSLNYEAPGGFIKKRECEPKRDVQFQITSLSSRAHANLIPLDELSNVRNHVTDLVVRDFGAKYLQKILDILSPERVANYDSWRDIVIMLAQHNPDYKPLAIWFSQRCPSAWIKGGLQHLDQIWEWAIARKTTPGFSDVGEIRSIATLYNWAKEDNSVKYEEIQEFNAFMKLHQMSVKHTGKLHETHFAEILRVMFGKKFVCDEMEHSTARGRDRRWYEFVFPDDASQNSGQAYKWRHEKYPDNLHIYITKKLPEYIETIKRWVDSKLEDNDLTEELQKYYAHLRKNLSNTAFDLGKGAVSSAIIRQCEIEFRDRGFIENLDRDPNVIGVGNGVLKIYPKTDLITHYHEIPIWRSTRVPYVREEIDLGTVANHPNPYIRHLFAELRRPFADDEDAFIFTMCYLSNSLDGRKKKPLFFIWLGEGSNGKSFILELHIKTLHECVRGGYGAKLNVAFFTKEGRATGPDSEKMMLKFARFSYCSESEAGDTLRVSKIKEFTSETLSANEKHLTQDMFEANCHFVFCSNHDPRITGRDYGTWRRILVYHYKMKFVDHPDPNNRFEYKCDTRLTDEIPYDMNYKMAYMTILVFFYEMFRDKYNCKLSNIPKPTIDAETRKYQDTQDTISRFITEQVVFIGECFPLIKSQSDQESSEPVKVPNISLTELATRYVEWHKRKIDNICMNNQEIIKEFPQTRLRSFIVKRFGGQDYLTQHRILDIGEEYEHTPDAKPVDLDDNIVPIEN